MVVIIVMFEDSIMPKPLFPLRQHDDIFQDSLMLDLIHIFLHTQFFFLSNVFFLIFGIYLSVNNWRSNSFAKRKL